MRFYPDDVIMETFSTLLAICAGNSRGIHAQRPVTRSFDVFFDLWINNREAGDLRRQRAHFDVIKLIV